MIHDYSRLVQDNDCHWYIIPSIHYEAWRTFCEIPWNDQRSWDVPVWATEVDGPSTIEFAHWKY